MRWQGAQAELGRGEARMQKRLGSPSRAKVNHVCKRQLPARIVQIAAVLGLCDFLVWIRRDKERTTISEAVFAHHISCSTRADLSTRPIVDMENGRQK